MLRLSVLRLSVLATSALLLAGLAGCEPGDECGDHPTLSRPEPGPDSGLSVEEAELRTEELEEELIEIIHAHASELGTGRFAVAARRRDGRTLHETTGGHPHGYRFTTHSTGKPLHVAAILHQVAEGHLSLDTRVVEVLPSFLATGVQREITLLDALSFQSGVAPGASCWRAADQVSYAACVDSLPTMVSPTKPGTTHLYRTDHLDIAGQMAVVAGGFADWEALWRDFTAATGLLAGATWESGHVHAASVKINVTAEESLDFLEAVRRCTFLTPELCAELQEDHTAESCAPLAASSWIGEDWHFALGWWVECPTSRFNCYSPGDPRRLATVGLGGQYTAMDRWAGYELVIGPTWDPDYMATVRWQREHLEERLTEWAGLAP